ncbi:sensor histidine kinase [Halalkalibacterium halodurans]|jgi:signal transduction histidine kinase|uniref:histidine kinase n=1 Tax=Halalkalibacterium halodurans TaxID=86665 RepID=A0A0M0KGB3_ALKHA|nr:HAMP domain-containing sensor histidine kinase [Halalkalibacterium halodurans]MED4163403.1 HAMP domain-containing sensor histidine kinase [Halalkalibacterium halodurans]TPE68566.1 HAMP domain-containing histidine kinase [Halalkalibacterium halodurans]
MSSIKRRIALQFSFQFIVFCLIGMITFCIVIFLILDILTKEELKRNFTVGALDLIVTETVILDGEISFNSLWEQELENHHMWLQILDEKGTVIYTVNGEDDLPSKYTFTELLQIEERQQYKDYFITRQLDSSYDTPYLFLLGFKNDHQELLHDWRTLYNDQGLVGEAYVQEVESQLSKLRGSLIIFNEVGDVMQTLGQAIHERVDPVSILARKIEPGSETLSIDRDEVTDYTWVLTTARDTNPSASSSYIQVVIITLSVVGAFVLLLGVAFTSWHAFRYGQPLLLFVGWLEKLEAGNYDDLLMEQEKQKILNHRGKVRMRYRLYEAVITAFYSVAQKLKHSENEKKRLEKVREEWLAAMSHDLRTPLSSIQGYGQLLESGQYQWSEEELQEMGEVISEKGAYMLQLIKDFSLTFELKNRDFTHTFTKVDLADLAERTVLKFRHDATLKEAVFAFEIKGEKPTHLYGNSRFLERLLDNLLINAINHNPVGTHIAVSVEQRLDQLRLCVVDNGVGMDEETRANLFERYYRGTNTEERTDGSGLGMSIAKAIVDVHKGTIDVQSSHQNGTKITIHFPLDSQDVSETDRVS